MPSQPVLALYPRYQQLPILGFPRLAGQPPDARFFLFHTAASLPFHSQAASCGTQDNKCVKTRKQEQLQRRRSPRRNPRVFAKGSSTGSEVDHGQQSFRSPVSLTIPSPRTHQQHLEHSFIALGYLRQRRLGLRQF